MSTEKTTSGPYWTLFIAHILSLLGIFTAMSTTIIAIIMAVAVLFLQEGTTLKSYVYKLIIKNIALFMFGILPILLFFVNAGNMMHMPAEDIGGWHILRGIVISGTLAIATITTVIMMIMDTIRLWDMRPKT